jgi:coenzyme PQQ precursor peptide PqqA
MHGATSGASFFGRPHLRYFQRRPRFDFGVSITPDHLGRSSMSWKTPKIVEVPVGMEINMYACAARK